jgi:hypothetical protein
MFYASGRIKILIRGTGSITLSQLQMDTERFNETEIQGYTRVCFVEIEESPNL